MISTTTGIKWDLTTGRHLIGRGSHCSYVADHNTVSREHAELEISPDGRIMLVDKGSRNGTVVNGQPLASPVELKAGDLIRFGNIEFRLIDERPAVSGPMASDAFQSLVPKPMNSLLSVMEGKGSLVPETIRAISDLGRMLVVPGSEAEMLEKALALLQNIIRFGRAAIFLADNESRLTLVSRRAPEGSDEDFQISQTVINEVLHQRNAVLIQDTLANAKYAGQHSIVAGNISSAMAVPLLYEDKVTGIIYLDSSYAQMSYHESDLQVVAIFANLLAAKMTNHDFLLRLKQKEALESELAIASQIQRGLLPQTFPSVKGYQLSAFQSQCLAVGGDLYDISLLKDGRIIFIIADVSGKGMGAALLASNILACFRILYHIEDFDLSSAIALTSDQMLLYSRSTDFATLFAGILDPRSNVFRFVNAGHNSPMVVRGDGDIKYLESSGMPIGLFKRQSWKEESIELGAGDFVFAFTDGVTEAANGEDEEFGEERLAQFLRPFWGHNLGNLTEVLDSKVRDFIGGSRRPSDDITMLVMGRSS